MQKRGTLAAGRDTEEKDEVFDRLIEVNRKAFEVRRFSAAYHALTGAVHWAADNENESQLVLVERLAGEQLSWIDIHAPGYEHSSQSAKLRGHVSIFQNLERQAKTTLLRLRSRRQFDNLLHYWPNTHTGRRG